MKHVLEPEDEDERHKRIRITLQKLDKSDRVALPPNNFDFGDRKTFHLEPPTELLSRIRTFLPQIEASNQALEEQVRADPRSVDIEAIEDSDTHVVEMNLGLGVFKIRGPNPVDSGDSDSDKSVSDSE